MEKSAPVFEAMNEADVREEVIAPLIRKLGYRTGTEHNVRREVDLRYSSVQLGRQKQSDPPLRGRADYILEAGGKVRWVVEAKAPSEELDDLIAAQAWTYANHPDVRATYFLVTNGRLFRLYQTNRKPEAALVLEFRFEEIEAKLPAILNTLAPASVLRDFPDVRIDEGEPLGPGLRSAVRISGGRLRVERLEPPIAPVDQMTVFIVDGAATRRLGGGIAVTYHTEVGVTPIQLFNEQIGLNSVELFCEDDVLSTDPARPSLFRASPKFIVPKGTPSFDVNTWQKSEAISDVEVEVVLEASGHLEGQDFSGRFESSMQMTLDIPNLGRRTLPFSTSGTFRMNLV